MVEVISVGTSGLHVSVCLEEQQGWVEVVAADGAPLWQRFAEQPAAREGDEFSLASPQTADFVEETPSSGYGIGKPGTPGPATCEQMPLARCGAGLDAPSPDERRREETPSASHAPGTRLESLGPDIARAREEPEGSEAA